MKPFLLLGIDKYHHARVICVILAADESEAARKLGGSIGPVRRVDDHGPDLLYFDRGRSAATFTPGDCTHEVLAKAAAEGGWSDANERLLSYYRYGTTNVYREYLLGSATAVLP